MFRDLSGAEQELSGGKGKTLAYLYQRKFPVPDGMVILPAAFDGDELSAEACSQVRLRLKHLRQPRGHTSFSVRSSALGEDSARASFAGQFETVLDVANDEEVFSAIRAVRQSRHSERVRAYSKARGITVVPDMAVVVELMVHADVSGVLFTADPVDGSVTKMIGNFIRGLGEKLVGGESRANSFALERPKGKYSGPPEIRQFAGRLYKMATRLEHELGCPQDIEWAVEGNNVYILQSRPITTLLGWDPVTGESNDSLTGNFAWSSVNVGEGAAVVMTPFTRSIYHDMFDLLRVVPGYSMVGNIGGREYMNITVTTHVMRALRMNVKEQAREIGGLTQENTDIFLLTLAPLSGARRLDVMFNAFKLALRQKRALRHVSTFIAETPAWCRKIRQRIDTTSSLGELVSIFKEELEPRGNLFFLVVWGTAMRYSDYAGRLRRELIELVGTADADTLLSGVSNQTEMLSSLGPVVCLSRVARGEMTREAYLEEWGHRGELEGEFYYPRPFENPAWFDGQLLEFSKHPVDVDTMLAVQRAQFDKAWKRFCERYPHKVQAMRRRLDRAAEYVREREAVRSEHTRSAWVFRNWTLRVGTLTGIGEDIFFMTRGEIFDLLTGKYVNLAHLPARRQTYERYKQLPCYPLFIMGRFDPFKWAADPNRLSDVFDSTGQFSSTKGAPIGDNVIVGMAGAAGKVEGVVRRLDSPEEGCALEQGEILVTGLTNIGWTLLFPRVGAIVTDIGAPLSHAAIVARELGIPAVVSCGNATQQLHTGDRVRVDGARGLVEILERSIG